MHLQQEANLADTLSSNERRRLALEALTAERSVLRTYREPHRVRESTWLRVREAAARLGLPVPPERTVGSGFREEGSKLDRNLPTPEAGQKVAFKTTSSSTGVAAHATLSEQPSNWPPAGCKVPSNVGCNVSSAATRREPASNRRRTHREPASKTL
jgi:hypothetical protein